MKIKPEQVPSEVVKAMLREWDRGTSVQPAALIAAAINAWPGMTWMDSVTRLDILVPGFSKPVIILPLPQKGE